MDNSGDAQILLVMDEVDAINFHKKGYDTNCKVIAYDSEFKSPLAKHLEKMNLLVNQNVLVKDPYTSDLTYHPLDSASKNLHIDYFKRYAAILSLLGATRVFVTEVNAFNETDSVGGSVGVGVKGGLGGKASGKWTSDSQVQELMSLDQSYEPKVDLAGAKKMMELFSLQNDTDLDMIIKAIETGTVYKYFDFSLNLSQKMQKVFNLAANIIPYGGIDIKTELESNKKIKETYTLHVRVEFKDSQTNE
ncbi:MAG: hypothetical protein IKQ16_09820 [Lentisphaeria bacterium]|nr:hypothetical protein [Lentisphaeria bacterium]